MKPGCASLSRPTGWAVELYIRKFFCDPREPEFIKRMRRQRLYAVAAPEELGLARNLLEAIG